MLHTWFLAAILTGARHFSFLCGGICSLSCRLLFVPVHHYLITPPASATVSNSSGGSAFVHLLFIWFSFHFPFCLIWFDRLWTVGIHFCSCSVCAVHLFLFLCMLFCFCAVPMHALLSSVPYMGHDVCLLACLQEPSPNCGHTMCPAPDITLPQYL